MTPVEYYLKFCHGGEIIRDEAQWDVLGRFDDLHQRLLKEHKKRQSIWGRLRKPVTVKGIYLWGSVGIGKTFLLDCFYNTLPFPQKKRIHFHPFMQWVHEQLKLYKGVVNPLDHIAKKLAKEIQVLCFDEFLVDDIANAMLLRQLLTAFFLNGITLVATSNTEPDKLYWRGLQRDSFLPAIELINQHTQVIQLQSVKDYRLRHLKHAQVFYTPSDEQAEAEMQAIFSALTQHESVNHYAIAIDERLIPVKQKSEQVIWFEFKDLCQSALSQRDYLEIAKRYKTVFISDIPQIEEYEMDTIKRFINLIDVFYDMHTRLVFAAATPINDIYPKGSLRIAFQRTCSRLTEMQADKYWNAG